MRHVEIFLEAAERVAGAAEALTPAQEQRTVPATPEWSVHNLVAHLTGAINDVVIGDLADAPSRAWTNKHVQQRRGVSAAEIAAELRERAPQVPEAALAGGRATPLWDLLVHEQDLREALGLHRAPAHTWQTLLPEATRVLGSRPGVNGFEVTTTEGTWRLGIPTTSITFDGDDYELQRVLFSRRTTVQIATRTTGVEVLEAASAFGPRSV